MVTVNKLLSKLEKIDIEDVIYEALVSVEDDYVRQQRLQMLEGFNSKGARIGVYASPLYKARKLAMNSLAQGYVDLKLTGAFQNDIFAKTDNDGLIVGSNDSKSAMLQQTYGESIFTLAPINKSKFIEAKLYPSTLTIIQKKLA